MSIRQILDWGTFVQKYHDQIDWKGLEAFVESVGMLAYYRIMNGICVDYLGFSETLFPGGRHSAETRVMEDLFCPEFNDPCPSGLPAQLLWRFRRWRRGEWKHKLVYPETMLRTFFVQVKSHLMKPAHLRL